MAHSKPVVIKGDLPQFYSKSDTEINDILEGRNAKNTKRATKSNIKTFTDYIDEKGLGKLEDLNMNELPEILQTFYPNLRRVDGEDYKLQSLKCIRAGINRWTKSNRNVDIIGDVRFTKANEIFKGVAKVSRQTGKGSTRSYPIIEDQDMQRIANFFLHDVLNKPDPVKVLKCVIFYVIYYFCRRGQENLYLMNIDTFEVGTDPDGKQYVFQAVDELDKNHRFDDTDPANQGRMYEQPGKITIISLQARSLCCNSNQRSDKCNFAHLNSQSPYEQKNSKFLIFLQIVTYARFLCSSYINPRFIKTYHSFGKAQNKENFTTQMLYGMTDKELATIPWNVT